MQKREATRLISQTLKQLFRILQEQPIKALSTTANDRIYTQATDSTSALARPEIIEDNAQANISRSSTARGTVPKHQVGQKKAASVKDGLAGPCRLELQQILASSRAKSDRIARYNLFNLQVPELKSVLSRWGYETEDMLKPDLIKQLLDVIHLEDSQQGNNKQAPASKVTARGNPHRLPEQSVGALLQAAILQGCRPETLPGTSKTAGTGQQQLGRGRPRHLVISSPATPSYEAKLAVLTSDQINEWLSDARTEDILVLDVEGICDFADQMVIASGRSNQHVHAAASGLCWQISQKVRNYDKPNSLYKEGGQDSDWIAIDTGRIVVHVMTKECRETYNLEELWDKRQAISPSDEETSASEEVQMGAL